jgi:hypothetical protein
MHSLRALTRCDIITSLQDITKYEEMNFVSILKGFESLILHAQGVFVDSDGYVAEGSVMNIGIITHEGELIVPPFDQALPGCTLKRLLHLIREVCSVAHCLLCMLRYVQHSLLSCAVSCLSNFFWSLGQMTPLILISMGKHMQIL